MGLVSKLEDENRRLRDELQHKNDIKNTKPDVPAQPETISKRDVFIFFIKMFLSRHK